MLKQRIVILGGGTAGWMAAAALSRFLPSQQYSICLVESEQIGTVGVGEATIPHIRHFNQWVGIEEAEFMQATGATYKLAIRFQGWGTANSDYYHPFGVSGDMLNDLPFHQVWWWLQQQHQPTYPFDHYSFAVQLAQQKRFRFPSTDIADVASSFNYAYQLDAGKYAMLLRQHATAQGVSRIEGKVQQVLQQPNGDISELVLEQGMRLKGDFFIDCSGFSALLIGQTLQTPFENWQQWLPCDRALAMPSAADVDPAPYTLSKTMAAGWRWRIPLQHRTGNGLVYASAFLADDAAEQHLVKEVNETGFAGASIKALRFTTGRRQQSWRHNCVAIGLAAGFLEPLESTSLHLIQLALEKLLLYFPVHTAGQPTVSTSERDAFNDQMATEYQRVRDFLILHYKVNTRPEPFWQYCTHMSLPDSLQQRLALFQESGQLVAYRQGLFQPASWLAVLLGQGARPNETDFRLQAAASAPYSAWLQQHYQHLQMQAGQSPSHRQALDNSSGSSNAPPVHSLYGYREASAAGGRVCVR